MAYITTGGDVPFGYFSSTHIRLESIPFPVTFDKNACKNLVLSPAPVCVPIQLVGEYLHFPVIGPPPGQVPLPGAAILMGTALCLLAILFCGRRQQDIARHLSGKDLFSDAKEGRPP